MLKLLPYAFKVWISSVLGSSALFTLWVKYFDASNHTVLNGIYLFTYVITVVVSGLLSVPAFLLFLFACWFLAKRSFTRLATNVALIILSLILTFITIRVVPSVDEIKFWSLDNLEIILCYWTGLVVGIISYRFQDTI